MVQSVDIRKGDTVLVVSGKYKGIKGTVLRAMPKENRLIVERVNLQKKHQRPTQDLPQGGIIEREGPIDRSNVMLVCPKCSRPTRIGFTVIDGEKRRTCKKCGEVIDK
ncbi:MAG TPA: 50S ribosomal protein L24 [Bacillota bacterium]|nr:50S ribosomal protein L24 [Candidatus Fermentithermobacillaceae bacterium]HOB30426.1 50S ribosomal protein L24 [Bacillota bacterium]HOK64325.1 50S ribosomal protein L24 [Bacillota bacterium]HOL11926.1 50S ribosomal protein L24 [Bacillota bacterium]HOQ03035.1 50S ribosomal protein L24 [Bacillota bacterium]